MSKFLKIFYAIQVVIIGLIITGVIPRVVALYWAGVLGVTFIALPLESAVLLFIASIPLYIALPITATFDSLNTWRILSIIILAKWLVRREVISELWSGLRAFIKKPLQFMREHRVLTTTSLLLLIAIISLIPAVDRGAGIKRIIYFINLSFIGIVAYDLIRRNQALTRRVIQALAIPTILVTIVGFVQLISTYFIDIYSFMRIWGEGIELKLFGSQWSYIAVWKGNTWFAYFGQQLSLRMFSLFPDSHSFPIFLLIGLCALVALVFRRGKQVGYRFCIVLVLLAMILTGTRGIWAGSVGVLLCSALLFWYMRRTEVAERYRATFVKINSLIIVFFLLFVVAYPILASQQFRAPKDNNDLLAHRLRSILDFGETSNGQRLVIWKASIVSIIHHPLLGVGIYNFPVVLSQKIILSKAGSSAHNIYLHIAAEMGLPALAIALYFIYLLLATAYRNFISSSDELISVYHGAVLICLPWVFIYLLTDFALFDERAFLLFCVTCAVIFGQRQLTQPSVHD